MVSQAVRDKYEVVIGLEVHAQLKTKSKIFAPDSTEFGAEPNSHTSTITLGMPGVLPVLNKECVNMGILLGLALNCEIPARCKFDRKQYFYPDLPKGYQISQYDQPICINGHIDINGKRIGITRAHLEEDAGKLVHAGADGLAGSLYSLVDLNRAGTPLLEIVSEPDMRSSEEARAYMEELRNIVRYIGVCDGNLEEGSMRCDANISVMPKGSDTLTINGLNFIKTDNMQHFGAPDEEGYEILQTVLYYFSPEKKTIYAFVMLINDEAAQQDLDDMLENVQFTHP